MDRNGVFWLRRFLCRHSTFWPAAIKSLEAIIAGDQERKEKKSVFGRA